MKKTKIRLAGVLAAVALSAVVLSGSTCNDVVRDGPTYRAEIDLMEQFSLQQADLLAGFVRDNCKCVKDDFPSQQCLKSAIVVLLVKRRIKWHKDMMLFNAGLIEDRPPKNPPDIPAPQTLCP